MKTKIFLGFILVYILGGFFLLPTLLKPKIIEAIETNLNAKVEIEDLSFNPLRFSIELDKIKLYDKQNNEKVFGLKKLLINLDPTYLVLARVQLSEIRLQKPYIYAKIDEQKKLNLLTLLKEQKQQKDQTKSSSSIKIVLENIVLDDGEIVYSDLSKKTPFHFSLEDIKLDIHHLMLPKQQENATLRLYTKVGLGGYFSLHSKIHSLDPLDLDGDLKLQANQLYNQWLYIKDNLNIEVADGQLFVTSKFIYNAKQEDKTQLKDMQVRLHKLRLKPKQSYQDILRLDNLNITDITYKLSQNAVFVKNVALDKLWFDIKRAKNGSLNWQEYLKTSFSTSKTPPKKEQSSKPLALKIAKLTLEKIHGNFDDSSVAPKVRTKLNDLFFEVDDFELNEATPAKFAMAMKLNDITECKSSGVVVQKPFLDITTQLQCSKFDITHYNPYITQAATKALKRYNVDIRSAMLDLALDAKISQKKNQTAFSLANSSVSLYNVAVGKRSTKEKIALLKSLKLQGINLQSSAKKLVISDIVVDRLRLYPRRYKNKRLNVETLIETKRSKRKKRSSSKPFHTIVKNLDLKNAAIAFYDRALKDPTTTHLWGINLHLKGYDSKERTFMRYRLFSRLNKKGKIYISGKLRHTPMYARSSLRLEKIELKDFSPYVQEHIDGMIKDGYIQLKANATYAKRSKQKPDLVLKGDLGVYEFALATPQSDSYLAAVSKLDMNDFSLELMPNRAYINTVVVDGLFVDAVIDENKTLNFSQLSKQTQQKEPKKEAKKEKKADTKTAFPFQIARIKVQNSNALFADYSLPIKFKTEIHELQGDIYALSNALDEISYIDLKGAVDRYGSMKLKGSVQSANFKNYTDITMAFRNLDLHALSGYSAQFAGYKIDKGKLFVDLAYKINAGALQGDNNIIIKNIELGEEIEDDNVSHLPLGLAIALLEDNDGMIDISMPVEGNVNNPDFKYGRLILKTFANLIVKAVAAPFKFLGAALGINAEELEFINYEAGSATLLPSEIEKLDKLVKVLIKRPKIKVVFTPTYEKTLDRYALKKKQLIAQLLKESQIKSDKDLQNAMTIELLEELYTKKHPKEILEKYHQKLKQKYKNDDIVAIEYQKALVKKVIKDVVLPKKALEKLAYARAEAIKEYLVHEKGIDPKRIGIKEQVSVIQEEAKKEVGLKVDIEVVP